MGGAHLGHETIADQESMTLSWEKEGKRKLLMEQGELDRVMENVIK